MHITAPDIHAALGPGDLELACALSDARRESARLGRVGYVYADAAGGWLSTTDRLTDRRPYYRVYPGGLIEPYLVRRPRRAV